MTSRIESEYDRIRSANRAEWNRRTKAILEQIPELAVIGDERAALMAAVGKGTVFPSEAQKRNKSLAEREDALLAAHDLCRDDLAMRYTCNRCRDTGWLGGSMKTPCSCRLLMEVALDPGQSINARETFASFDRTVYPSAEQWDNAVSAYDACVSFADSLPLPRRPFLLLMGGAGLGKSFFGNAIAYRALERGIPAMRMTSYTWQEQLIKDMRASQGFAASVINAPLLSLDDLGSEPDIPNVTNEHVFALVNERIIARRPTVIGTNLTLAQLRERYGDRVFTRLTDTNLVYAKQLKGENLRGRVRPC